MTKKRRKKMLSEDGKFLLTLILFIFGIFACGYFIGWTRSKVTIWLIERLETLRHERNRWMNRADTYAREIDELRDRAKEDK